MVIAVAALIVVILMFTPAFLDEHSGLRMNAAATVGTLHLIGTLESQYAAAHPQKGFACDPSLLVTDADTREAFGDPLLSGHKAGYYYRFADCSAENDGVVRHYRVTAFPIVVGTTGTRAFCIDESGGLFYDPDGDGMKCLASGKPIQ